MRATKYTAIPTEVKRAVAERDSVNGWPCCICCGRPAPAANQLAYSNAHFIPRSFGGLGVVENIVTLCPDCHRRFDQSGERGRFLGYIRKYLKKAHPGWDAEKLIYKKENSNAE